jgi:hypothetical protein
MVLMILSNLSNLTCGKATKARASIFIILDLKQLGLCQK